MFKTNNLERLRIKANANSIAFNTNRSVTYQPAQGLIPEIMSFGSDPSNSIYSIASCSSPYLNTQTNYQFNGTIQLWGNSYSGGNINLMEVGFDGANSIIDATGTSTTPNTNALLLNYYCGHNVFVGNSVSGDLTANHNFYTLGKAGIGTSTPSEKFEVVHNDGVGVSGGISLKNLSTANKNSEIKFKNYQGNPLWAIGCSVSHNNNQDSFIYDNVANSGSGATRFLLTEAVELESIQSHQRLALHTNCLWKEVSLQEK